MIRTPAVIVALTLLISAAASHGAQADKKKVAIEGESNASQTTTVTPNGKKFEFIAAKPFVGVTTTVTGGVDRNGSGDPVPGGNQGSESHTSVGFGLQWM